MSYFTRFCDRLCDRHTATATQSPPHGHRHTVTVTRLLPHGYRVTRNGLSCQVTWQVMWPPHGHRYTCRIMCRVTCRVMWWVMCQVVSAPGPRALSAALGPLVPTATPSLWPMATLSSWPTLFVNHGRWRPSPLRGPRPLAASNLRRPLAHGAPLATIGYQGVVVIRNGRVIEPIVRGGGHGGRGGRGGRSGYWP